MKNKYNFFKNSQFAFMGIKALLKEKAFQIELFFIIPLLILAFFIAKDYLELILLVIVLINILVAEAFNTAIEACVDLYTKKWQSLAKLAKDCASAGVFFAILIASFSWLVILWMKI